MKNKKTIGEHSLSKPVPPVKQVVEVIEEETIASVAEAPQEEAVPTLQEESAESAPTTPSESELKEEAVVAELFKRPQPTRVMPEIAMHTEGRSKKKVFMWMLIALVLSAIVIGGVFVAQKGKLPTIFVIAPTPTPTPSPTPTPTPQPVNRKDMKLQVLNGGGVPGAAGKMKAFLEDKGWNVVDVSNADAYTYTKTEVHVKAAKTAYQKLLIDDLKDTYSVATDTSSLTDSVSFDARVVVGKE